MHGKQQGKRKKLFLPIICCSFVNAVYEMFFCLFSSSCFDFVFCCLKLMSNLCCWQWLSSGNGKTNPLFVSTIKQQQRQHSNMKNTNAHLFTNNDTHTCIYSWTRHRHNYQYYIGNKRKRTNKQKNSQRKKTKSGKTTTSLTSDQENICLTQTTQTFTRRK